MNTWFILHQFKWFQLHLSRCCYGEEAWSRLKMFQRWHHRSTNHPTLIQNPENKLIWSKVQTRTSSFLILSFDVNKRVKVCVRGFNILLCSPWRPAEPHQKVWPLKQNSFALWRGRMTRCTSWFLFYLNSAIISHLSGQIIFLRWRCTLPQDVNPEVQNHPVWT